MATSVCCSSGPVCASTLLCAHSPFVVSVYCVPCTLGYKCMLWMHDVASFIASVSVLMCIPWCSASSIGPAVIKRSNSPHSTNTQAHPHLLLHYFTAYRLLFSLNFKFFFFFLLPFSFAPRLTKYEYGFCCSSLFSLSVCRLVIYLCSAHLLAIRQRPDRPLVPQRWGSVVTTSLCCVAGFSLFTASTLTPWRPTLTMRLWCASALLCSALVWHVQFGCLLYLVQLV